jgi:hypothetical protein
MLERRTTASVGTELQSFMAQKKENYMTVRR